MTTALNTSSHLHWNKQTIRGLRKFLRLSQSAFSQQLGVRQQTVSEWETGVYEPRGASTTLLNMVAMSAGFNPDAAGQITQPGLQQPLAPQPTRAETRSTIGSSRGFDSGFPPSAPSTQKEIESDTTTTSSTGRTFANHSRAFSLSTREVPM
jgi:DNA-binding XRE family transcriptional regulator